MEPVRIVTGRAVPLDRADVDTDQIIPSSWLKRIERTGYAEGLFAAWRKDPAFVLNDARFRGASILLAGDNFGCGSSREHAVWALREYGFRAVLAPRFADIFRANCLKDALVPVTLDGALVSRLMRAVEADPSLLLTVDVARRRLRAPGAGVDTTFALDDFSRRRLLAGLDEIALTLRHARAISDYETRRQAWLPTVVRPRP